MRLYDVKPIFEAEAAPLTPEAFPTLVERIPDSTRGSLEKLLAKMRQHLEDGELIKAEHNELKYINRRIEEAMRKLIAEPYFHAGRYENLPEWLRDLDYHVAMHTIPARLKKAEALQKKHGEHEMLTKYIAFMKELMPLKEAMDKLKGMIVKKKSGDVAKAEAKEKYTANVMAHEDVVRVKRILTEITKQLRDEVLKSNYQYLLRIVDNHFAQYNPDDRSTGNYQRNARNPFARSIINAASVDKSSMRDPEERREDYKDVVRQEATKMTDEVLDAFIDKQTAKLAEILVKKNNLKSVKLKNARTGSGVIEGMLELDFEDKSGFDVNNKVVWGTSKLGKMFNRFPTTFHNVRMPNGKALSGKASEQRMKEEFAA